MQSKKYILISLVAAIISASNLYAVKEMQPIQSDQIGVDFELIGALGIPIGKEVEVEGVIIKKPARHSKEEDHRIAIIDTVGGKKLEEPIEIGVWRHNNEPTEQRIKMIVAEDTLLTYFGPSNAPFIAKAERNYPENIDSRQVLSTGLAIKPYPDETGQ